MRSAAAILFTLILSLSSSSSEDLPTKEEQNCNGVFLSYAFLSREKEFPHVKNSSAQAWAFKSVARVLNTGDKEVKSWKMFVGFKHEEILVSADGAVLVGGDDFPASVGNGTFFAGYPLVDLKTAIETASDLSQIQAEIPITGTQFGVKPPGVPMPKTIRLENDGFECPAPTTKGENLMFVCCAKDAKYKTKEITQTKFFPRQKGDMSLTYDVLRAYEGNYLAQVTIDNQHPLGRLDRWNLTWEWMRGEFIYAMRGAYTHLIDTSDCLYGAAGKYYKSFDFSTVMSCEKNPIISDLPPDRSNDDKVGKLQYCCRNGSLLPATMDVEKSRAVFQLEVYKSPPDINRTALYPPQKWKINGFLNPEYKCGPPVRVDPSEFPDRTGLEAVTTAIASWQVVCGITHPKTKPSKSRCCVSFSAYYNDTVVPCNTCACGCVKNTCDARAPPLMLPPEALLVPFDDRREKALAWARIKNFHVPKVHPCADNCGVSINWHITTDYKDGWTARITLLNWENIPFEDWFAAVQMDRAGTGFDRVYSFNGTRLPELNDTIFLQGLPGLDYLIGLKNGSDPVHDPRVPGKQQSVILFKKGLTPGINVERGDGFPTKVMFNGEQCSLPTMIPVKSSASSPSSMWFMSIILVFIPSLTIMGPLIF